MACITTCDTILFAYFAYSSDEDEKEKIDKFWWWIIFPIPGCGMIALYFGIKLLSGVVPKRILEKHMFSIKKVVAMRMNAEESVQAFGLAIAIGCALFMFGNYGAEEDFHNEAEKILLFAVMGTGFACLIVTAAWNMVAIRVEMKRRGKILRQSESSSSSSEAMLAGASSFWFYLGVLATTLLSILYVARAATLDESYFTLAMAGLPVVILVYFWSFFCQPRKISPKNMWKLRLHFASSYDRFFHFSLKLQANIGRLPDEDLETFLVDTLFKGGLKTPGSTLFLLFRTTKCVIEEGDLAECSDSSWCATCISVYLLPWFLTKLVQGSVRSEW
ncbi:hypothetical protein TL16_g08571 [Triparma laevis f. inornata]|uniref:Uncharacterized protein n=1 Tax=Triparma laevis f. inornata TaxID=1714386 RepID=A0A9W7AY93_9STRA|nr:hypothetical protein TL16_g08571 [Triparma laevis f. inornata]